MFETLNKHTVELGYNEQNEHIWLISFSHFKGILSGYNEETPVVMGKICLN